MPLKFNPNYTITPKIANCLIRIESVKGKVLHLPLNPKVINTLRESAKLFSTHYSTMIEGNRLTSAQLEKVILHENHFPGKERDERLLCSS